MRQAIWYTIFLLLSGACIDPFNARVPDGQEAMVVDGSITDQPGPYRVKIFKSAALSTPFDEIEWVNGATVTISDDSGGSETLYEYSPGNYETTTVVGTIGRTYVLRIVTRNGTTYESSPEKLLPVGDFSNLRYEWVQKLSGSDDDPTNPLNGFNIYLDADIAPEQDGLVRWRWTGTFEIKTNPELRVKLAPGPIIAWLPDPYPCSGWTVPPHQVNMFFTGVCTCCYCWVNQHNESPIVSESRFVNNNKITQQYIAFIPASNRFFLDKYYLDVEQLSTSREIYDFWKKVGAQGKQGSDLFQTPPAATTGNIHLKTEGGLAALGVFYAAAVKKHSFIIPLDAIPYQLPVIDSVALNCLEVYPEATTTKPDFW